MAKMRPEIKKQWLEALRSGEYKQGKGVLHNIGGDQETGQDTFCCLGVLCDLAYKAGAVEREVKENYEQSDVYDYGNGTGMPPNAVAAWACDVEIGVGTEALDQARNDLAYAGKHAMRWLPGLNDHEGYTFEEIAAVI